jgi:3-phosphoglycerate kinase
MELKRIQDADLKNKKVLMRVDFNVAVEKEDAKEKYKIFASKETIDYILSQEGVKLALVGHLGRPTALKNCLLGSELLVDHPEISIDSEFSLKQLADDAERILGIEVKFVEDCIGEKVAAAQICQYRGEVLLLENVRFYCNDEKNDLEFSKKLAENFDVFVSDAFSVCHRDQSSVTGAAKLLPSYAGFWVEKEIENLEKVRVAPESPAVAIIGGAKIETKLPLIQEFEKKYDHILVGGKIANEALDQGLKFSDKVILPIDFAQGRMDIGPKTIEKFQAIIKTAKTIVWNGPLGKFEEKPFDAGTEAVLEAVLKSDAFTLIGGGETVEILEKKNLLDQVSFVSTGGGAMLEYLSGNPMPGIEVLKK